MPPLPGVPVFTNKTVKFSGLKEDSLARETNALETAFPDPAHNGRAVDMSKVKSRLAESQQARIEGGAAVGFRTVRRAARGSAGMGGFGNGFHQRREGLARRLLSVNLFTINIAKQTRIVNDYRHYLQFS